ncbi:MAG: DUF6320 domain-containing protein [Oscillospiraceae bacterium]
MYCIKCGVELADSEEKCPLCFTRVYHPDIERKLAPPLFPETAESRKQTVSRLGALFIITSIFALGVLLPLICNLSINKEITWSGYVIGAVMLTYIIVVLPIWFKRPNPVVFVPCDFAACALYLLYIDLFTQGGWFLSFALPVTAGIALITTAVVALCRYVRRGYLYIFGGATILTGFYSLLIEALLNVTFLKSGRIVWSVYPLICCFVIGMGLIVIAICPSLRRTLEKKFFV